MCTDQALAESEGKATDSPSGGRTQVLCPTRRTMKTSPTTSWSSMHRIPAMPRRRSRASLCRMLKLCTTTARSSCGKRSLQSSRDFNREIQDKVHGRKEPALSHTVAHPEPPVVTTGEAVDELIHQHTADTASTAEVLIQQQYIKIHQNTSKYISNTSVSVTTHVVSYTVWIHQSVQQYSHT